MSSGSLIIVGTGIQLGADMTLAAKAHIEQADVVLYVAGSQLMADWITSLNPAAKSLVHLYAADKNRMDTYNEMVAAILSAVRAGNRVCAVFYGHPGVFVTPSHRAIQKARAEGFEASMLPGISAEACLFADLGFDPAAHGCQTFEATDFLIRRRIFDPYTTLILWQIEVVGHMALQTGDANRHGLQLLTETLLQSYPAVHPVTVYMAAMLPIHDPFIHTIPLSDLPAASIPAVATLYIPPLAEKPLDPEMMARLKLTTRTQVGLFPNAN